MRIENDDDFDIAYYRSLEEKKFPETLHELIFSAPRSAGDHEGLAKSRTVHEAKPDPRISAIFSGLMTASETTVSRPEAEGRVDVSISWGGNEPTKTSVSVGGSVKDDHGGNLKGDIKVEDSGRTTLNIGGGKESSSSRDKEASRETSSNKSENSKQTNK